MFEEGHPIGTKVPKERGVDEPPLFFDVEGVAATFFMADDKVVFPQLEVGNVLGKTRSGPSQNRFGVGRKRV